MTKNRILILFGGIGGLVLILLFSFWFIFVYTDTEQQDWAMLRYERESCKKLFAYYFTHNQRFPTTLQEASVRERFTPVFYKSFILVYRPSSDGKDFRMAAKVNNDFVAFFAPQWQYLDIKKPATDSVCFGAGLAYKEGVQKQGGSLPTYRVSNPPFSNPSEWPKLSE